MTEGAEPVEYPVKSPERIIDDVLRSSVTACRDGDIVSLRESILKALLLQGLAVAPLKTRPGLEERVAALEEWVAEIERADDEVAAWAEEVS